MTWHYGYDQSINVFTTKFISENTNRLHNLLSNYNHIAYEDVILFLGEHCEFASTLPFRPRVGGIQLNKAVDLQEKYQSMIYYGKTAWFLDSEECALYILTEYE